MSENKLKKDKCTLPHFSLRCHHGQGLSHSSHWASSHWSKEGLLIYLLVSQRRKLGPREGMQPAHAHLGSQNPFSVLYPCPWSAGRQVWISGAAQLSGCWVTQDAGGLGVHPWCLYNLGQPRLAGNLWDSKDHEETVCKIPAASWQKCTFKTQGQRMKEVCFIPRQRLVMWLLLV